MPVQKIDKNEFLLRCWEVFHLQGYHHTSMADLAKATGLQKAGLYHHFETKQALMEAVMEFALQQFRSYVLSVADDLSLRPEERLEKLMRRHKKLAILHRRGCFFANVALETGREDLFNRFVKSALDEWAEAVSRLLVHKMPEARARLESQRLVMEYEGAVLFYKMSGEEKYLEEFVTRTVRNFSETGLTATSMFS
jgi:AcrR family transcriptional regulator